MKIKLKNLGAIKQAEFEMGDLTIICGKNNTGKTYTTYALFGFLEQKNKFLKIMVNDSYVKNLLQNGSISIDLTHYTNQINEILKTACQKYSKKLADVFASKESLFKLAEFNIKITKEPSLAKEFKQTIGSNESGILSLTKEKNNSDLLISLLISKEKITIPHSIIKDIIADSIIEILFDDLLPVNTFIASAERTGAAIFKDELDFSRTHLLKEMHKNKEEIDVFNLLLNRSNNYALPVEKNVEFTRKLKTISKKNSFITKNHTYILDKFNNILNGNYKLDKDDNLNFYPKGSKIKLELGESSSAVRSLLDIGFYIKHIAKPNDLLIIDEPELNLHPENQRLIAQILANLVNIGIKVFITTHSDYIIKEFSNLIMLNSNDDYIKKIASDEGYTSNDLLNSQQVKMYVAKKTLIKLDGNKNKTKNNTLSSVKINDKSGIADSGFDDTINKMNKIQQSIIWQ
jgi:predicted ATP-dependent endonuclease of OLD family